MAAKVDDVELAVAVVVPVAATSDSDPLLSVWWKFIVVVLGAVEICILTVLWSTSPS